MNLTLPTFRRGLPAAQVDRSLRESLTVLDAARQSALIWFHEILSRRLYNDLGYASMEQYATAGLGFSRNRTNQFLRLAKDLGRLPPLKEAVLDGRLEWTKAQQVGRVATPETALDWVDLAEKSSRRELSQGIKAARRAATEKQSGQEVLALSVGATSPREPAPLPAPRVAVGLMLDSLDAARLEALIEAAKKSGVIPVAATREEAILAALGALVEDVDAVRRRTGQKAQTVRRRTAAAAVENAVIHDEGHNRNAIPPGLREKVLARDQHRCQAAGCNAARFLEVHHKIPRVLGGTNDLANLTTLCGRCHRFVHHRQPQVTRDLTARPG